MSHQAYILIPVYNRKAITLACLETLQHNGDLDRYQVVVIDDGSTDGTAEAITAAFPAVHLLRGDGKLWWTGAIAKGMEYAYNQGADFFFWLNDDTLPCPSTLDLMLVACAKVPRQVISAQCYTDDSLIQPTYGGRRVKGLALQFLAAASQEQLTCDVCSGNLVCLPRSLIDAIGYPPSQLAPQAWGDVIYTWWAKQAGFDVSVLGSAVAVCPHNPLEEGWSSSTISMRQRWQLLESPKSSIYPPAYRFYCQQVHGRLGLILFVSVYTKLVIFTVLRSLLPLSWIRNLKKIKDRQLANHSKTENLKP